MFMLEPRSAISRLAPLAAALLLVPLVSCDDPVGSLNAPEAAASAVQQVAFQGTFSGTVTGLFPNPERCPPEAPLQLNTTQTGTLEPFGEVTSETTNCTSDPAPGPAIVRDGRITITDADGDELRGTFRGQQARANPNTGTAHVALKASYDGGSGKFAGSTGQGAAQGTIDLSATPAPALAYTLEGTLRLGGVD